MSDCWALLVNGWEAVGVWLQQRKMAGAIFRYFGLTLYGGRNWWNVVHFSYTAYGCNHVAWFPKVLIITGPLNMTPFNCNYQGFCKCKKAEEETTWLCVFFASNHHCPKLKWHQYATVYWDSIPHKLSCPGKFAYSAQIFWGCFTVLYVQIIKINLIKCFIRSNSQCSVSFTLTS